MKIDVKNLVTSIIAITCLFTFGAQAQTAENGGVDMSKIVENYANIGLASYQDSLETAELLRVAIEELLNNPTEDTLVEARSAWRTARIPYEQSEVFVGANALAKDWVNRVNAWPIEASFIDYVEPANVDNIINARTLMIDGAMVEIEKITPELIAQSLHLVGAETSKVASGYHVVEFLLWGEDNSAEEEPGVEKGAGQRLASDFDLENCTNDNCSRRGDYLYSAVNLLVDDLKEMVANWQVTGETRRALLADPMVGLSKMFEGLGSLSYGELAGDRLQTSLLNRNPQAELDPFSNNSHVSYLFNARGVVGVYFGEYFSLQGELTRGPSLADLMESEHPVLDEKFRTALGHSMARMRLMIDHARDVEAFDLMIAQGNGLGNNLVQAAVDGLVTQASILQEMVMVLDLPTTTFAGSDALDNLEALSQ